ncbi:hypothetical protein EKO23_00280 [Nocardioides guangzhouensis]|uniref:Uncharacterized protein n=1 Tax=Nocardioides guangzhouensis TaxID=2497878 RepID=A0A4Q4ZLU6_9ACTN|nr:hypothetical protein [Nocardioides guangzhouensis]RYP88915.1 hypothetical protein EKO23_00280 [Nocardioides guangzhouensis]
MNETEIATSADSGTEVGSASGVAVATDPDAVDTLVVDHEAAEAATGDVGAGTGSETTAGPGTCPRCDAERLEGVPFCTNCSLRFLPAEAWIVRQAEAPSIESIPARRRRWPWVLLLLLVLVAGAAAAAYLLLGWPPDLDQVSR